MSPAKPDSDGWKSEIVRCPISGERLSPADETLLQRLRQLAAIGKLYNRSGDAVQSPITDGLVNESKQLYYQKTAGVFVLSAEEAIELGSV